MRILHLISSSGYYGAESMLLNLVRELRACGYQADIGVIQKTGAQAELLRIAREAGIPSRSLISDCAVDPMLIVRLRTEVTRGRFDLVHTHGYKADLYGYWATRFLSVPLVASVHGWTYGDRRLRFYARQDVHVLRRFRSVVSVSARLSQELISNGIRADHLSTIANGVDFEAFCGAFPADVILPADTEHVVGGAARLVPEKGIQYLIEAVPEILRVKPRTTFLIAGEGPYQGELERFSRDLGIAARVVFLGRWADMPALYKRLDVMVLPSLREGTPMCILEAMAAGIPVVASNIGGIPAVIESGANGLLVEPRSPTQLAEGVLSMLLDPDYARRLAGNGQMCVRSRFSASHMAFKYAAIYRGLVPSANPRHRQDCENTASA